MARIERDRKVTSPSLPRAYPFVPRRGAGSVVEDVDGNIFLDLNAGIAVTSTGHCHPKVVEAVQRQASELLHYSASDFYLPIYSDVCERLDAMAPFPAGALVPHQLGDRGGRGGDQAGPLRHRPPVPDRLLPVVPRALDGVGHADGLQGEVPHELRTDAAERVPLLLRGLRLHRGGPVHSASVSPTEVAAIVVESLAGRGRVHRCRPTGWFRYLRELCDRHGILLVCDEVQSGMGRSGTMWAIEH